MHSISKQKFAELEEVPFQPIDLSIRSMPKLMALNGAKTSVSEKLLYGAAAKTMRHKAAVMKN